MENVIITNILGIMIFKKIFYDIQKEKKKRKLTLQRMGRNIKNLMMIVK